MNYFSSLSTQQLYHTNIYEMTNRTRSIAGSVSGAWSGVSVTGNYRRDEIFGSETSSNLNGYAPSVNANLSSKRIGMSPFYLAFNSEAARVLYVNRSEDASGVEFKEDLTLGRVDVSPTLRATISTLPYLSVNGTVVYRHTYLTESLDEEGAQVEVPVTRRYFDFRADVVGPVFSRVFNPNNGFADRLKHVIEPNVSFQRTTDYDTEDRIPSTSGVYDVVIGGVTRVNYGVTNRLLLRKAPTDPKAGSAAGAPREFLNASLTQTYYTDPRASQFDTNYQSGYGDPTASSFSPVALTGRTNPTAYSSGTVRMEDDATLGILEGFNADWYHDLSLGANVGGVEPAPVQRGFQAELTQRANHAAFQSRQNRRQLFSRLGHRRQDHHPATLGGVLQRAVLRPGAGVSGAQLSRVLRIPLPERPPFQPVIHTRRNRDILELLWCVRRHDVLI